MKILLIQTPYTIYKYEPKGCQPPLGLAYIAAVLEQFHNVKILDCISEGFEQEKSIGNNMITYGLSFENICKKIEAFNPQVIGISCLFSTQLKNVLKVASLAKKFNPNIKIVLGGAHPSINIKELLSNSNIDFIIIGEGEASFLKLCNSIEKNDNLYQKIDGIAYKSNNLELKFNEKKYYISNLDSLPFPGRHLLQMEKYFSINSPHGISSIRSPNTSVITSRGCPMHCIFCSIHTVWGKKFRARSPENVIAELKHLKEKYGVKEIQFEDDNLTFDKKRAKKLFHLMIEEKLDMAWTTPNGLAIYSIDEELVSLMKKSGCYRVCLAIESGDQDTLNNIIHKPVNLKKVPQTIKIFKKYKIITDAFFVVGFPGETKEKIEKTFKFARSLGVQNINFFIATPYPGTELYEICKTNNYIRSDYDTTQARVGQAHIATNDFTKSEIYNLVKRQNLLIRLEMLLNPSVFYNRLIKRFLKDPRFVLNYIKNKVF